MSRHHRLNQAGWNRVRLVVLARDKRRCRKCGKAGKLEVHHIVPLAAGGSNELSNLESRCITCHIATHNPPDPDRVAWQAYLKELSA